MSKSEDQQAAAILRQIENRIVWFGTFLVNRAKSNSETAQCAKAADTALDEYQQRFPAIQPPS